MRWRLGRGYVYRNLFIDEPGGRNFPAYEWFEVWLNAGRWRVVLWRWRTHWLNGGPTRAGAQLCHRK